MRFNMTPITQQLIKKPAFPGLSLIHSCSRLVSRKWRSPNIAQSISATEIVSERSNGRGRSSSSSPFILLIAVSSANSGWKEGRELRRKVECPVVENPFQQRNWEKSTNYLKLIPFPLTTGTREMIHKEGNQGLNSIAFPTRRKCPQKPASFNVSNING